MRMILKSIWRHLARDQCGHSGCRAAAAFACDKCGLPLCREHRWRDPNTCAMLCLGCFLDVAPDEWPTEERPCSRS